MIKFLFIILFLVASNVYAENMPFIRVIDGDTIESRFYSLPAGLQKVSIRIADIDAGETNYLAKCQKEKDQGNVAAARLRQLMWGVSMVEIKTPKWDKYGGRIDAVVYVNGVNIGDLLLSEGLVKKYTGAGPKPDWCK